MALRPVRPSVVSRMAAVLPPAIPLVSPLQGMSQSRGDPSGFLPPAGLPHPVLVLLVLAAAALLALGYFLGRRVKEKASGVRTAQRELLDQAEFLRTGIEAAGAGLWEFFPARGMGRQNRQWYLMLGYPPSDREVSRAEWESYLHPEDLPAVGKGFMDYIRSGGEGRFETEFRLRHADGSWRWTVTKAKAVEWDGAGNPTRIVGLNLDTQSMKVVQDELRRSEERFHSLFRKAPLPLANVHRDGTFIEVNDCFVRTLGYTIGELPDVERWLELAHPDPDYRKGLRSKLLDAMDRAFSWGSLSEDSEIRVTCGDGTVRTMIAGGNVIGNTVLLSFFDITDRKREEAERLERMELLRATLNATTDGILVVNKEKRITQVNRQFFRMWNIPPELQEVDDDERMLAFVARQMADPEGFLSKVRMLYQSRLEDLDEIRLVDGRVFERYSSPMILAGKEIGRVWDFRDISERKLAEKAIDFERRQLLSIFDSLDDIVYVSDPFTYEILFANKRLRDQHEEDLVGKLCYEALQGFDRPCDFCTNPIILNSGGRPHFWKHHNTVTHIDVEIVDQIIRWPDGRDVRLEFAKDVTERTRAEAEREKLQGELLQSRKLEAVGTLAGGVAHDFNNMLGVITGYAELMLGEMGSGEPHRESLEKILEAAQRSSALTRQLLAFARRQAVAPVVFDLNESVESMLKMLRRLIGENISLAWHPGAGPCIVKMDPSQLDQVLANLCVNARDAIGDIGRITIETGTFSMDESDSVSHGGLAPGEYVGLSVSDDGCGMDRETMEHIFEPFFTTKGVGKGTGLGLATVYGIVKQNNGSINAYSEPGKGSVFRICLPRHPALAGPEETGAAMTVLRGKGETILFVEDDPTLLEIGRAMLLHLGYAVLPAATPGEVIRLAEGRGGIDLIVTDVVMPEMNGKELAERLLKIRPGMKLLFMSGYTADVIARQGVLEEGVNFIQKPFSMKELAKKIREVLY